MSWPSVTKDKLRGFKPKHEIEFLKIFYKNVKPDGMDKFKSVVLDHSNQGLSSGCSGKSLFIDKNNYVKNSLNARSKIYVKTRDKISTNFDNKSQYETYALLNIAGRH